MLLLYIISLLQGLLCISGAAGGKSPQLRRISAEWKDVVDAGLDMSVTQIGGRSVLLSVGNGTELVRLMPHPRNAFEWHFTFAGPQGTEYEGGLYHGCVQLPANYPNSAPSVRLLTPNGRFQENAKICLSATDFHQETWTPSWTVRTLVTALMAHMTTTASEIGGIRASAEIRKGHAVRSRTWRCPSCNVDHKSFPSDLFPKIEGDEAVEEDTEPESSVSEVPVTLYISKETLRRQKIKERNTAQLEKHRINAGTGLAFNLEKLRPWLMIAALALIWFNIIMKGVT